MGQARQEFEEEWDYFCSRIKFANSPLDARAIFFMNNISKQLNKIEKEAVKIIKK